MANPGGAIANVAQVNPTTQPAAAKPAVNVAKTTPPDSVNISAAGRAASQRTQSQPPTDADYDGDSKQFPNASRNTFRR
jgi:hypothetical protein